ncbi:MAG TPA: cysteine dioxygenase family protein [Pyrinomonadaceae bacterium]|jgi:cysteine dioxygenase
MSTSEQAGYELAAVAARAIPPGPLRALTEQFAALEQRPALAEMTAWLRDLHVEAADLRPYVSYKEKTYARHRVFRNEHVELLVLCWRPGQRTPIHDHSGSYGVVRVWSGVMWETMFEMDARRGLVYRAGRDWRAGALTGADVPDIHQLGNPDVSGQDLITLHLYAPPLVSLNIYTPGRKDSTSTLSLNSWNPTI